MSVPTYRTTVTQLARRQPWTSELGETLSIPKSRLARIAAFLSYHRNLRDSRPPKARPGLSDPLDTLREDTAFIERCLSRMTQLPTRVKDSSLAAVKITANRELAVAAVDRILKAIPRLPKRLQDDLTPDLLSQLEDLVAHLGPEVVDSRRLNALRRQVASLHARGDSDARPPG